MVIACVVPIWQLLPVPAHNQGSPDMHNALWTLSPQERSLESQDGLARVAQNYQQKLVLIDMLALHISGDACHSTKPSASRAQNFDQ